jgi:pimeloyl-ACP methyl ester carboxylesterase
VPAFLVHGVPDTHRMWDPLRAVLDRDDVIAPDLPGFGNAMPSGFTASKEQYLDWLVAAIEEVGEPVDLVGHDWGALLVQRVLGTRPDLLRTCCFGSGALETTGAWHDFARTLQSDAGDEAVRGLTSEAVQGVLLASGVDAGLAASIGTEIDVTMKDAILGLYRSAVDIFETWSLDAPAAVPTLLIAGHDDPFARPGAHVRLAERIGAECVVLDCGHWWAVERPQETADALQRLWR